MLNRRMIRPPALGRHTAGAYGFSAERGENMSFTLTRAICVVALQLVIATLAQSASAQETAKGLLAVQARAQGYVCDSPVSAKRDKKHSGPDVAVWVLRCEDNSYRMRLAPDMAARVQQLN
jgi:hypothetical protein